MKIDPNKPVGWLSITSMLAGGILAKILADSLLPSSLYLGVTVLFFVVLGSIVGLITGRIIEAQVRYNQDGEVQAEAALAPTEEAGQPTSEDLQDKDNCLRILMAVFGLVMALALIAFMLTGNLG